MKKFNLNNKAFSLIEIMVTVAIVGLLATVGTVQYEKFKARTKRVTAKTLLAAGYIHLQSHHTEWQTYTQCIVSIGLESTPNQNWYSVGFGFSTPATSCLNCGQSGSSDCTEYATSLTCPLGDTAVTATNWHPGSHQIQYWELVAGGGTCGAPVISRDSFRLSAAGFINSSTNTDEFYIDNNKAIVQTKSGL